MYSFWRQHLVGLFVQPAGREAEGQTLIIVLRFSTCIILCSIMTTVVIEAHFIAIVL